jgi:predicted phage terminase large subunit-like protein
MKEGQSRGYHLPISGDTRKKPDKFQRVENISPYFERGLIYFNQAEKNNPNMQRLIDQLLMFEKGSKAPDDAPDALEGAIFKIQEKARTKVAPDVGHLKNSTKRY